ncbi:MAG: hypothetical protein KDA87_07015 [Planctomycetales bacterium]|nr:hypothetical protein [Planctomycetales bacterium]
MPQLSRYHIDQSYDWNYQNPPSFAKIPHDVVAAAKTTIPGTWSLCGLPAASPLGIAAGPLLNGDWLLYYAGLGFDILTYKTVRSAFRPCYAAPNLQPVAVEQMTGSEESVSAETTMKGTWAVSFGMPSQEPEVWRTDVARIRRQLPAEKLLCVSVVGTMQPNWTIDDLADDYARCAAWAVHSGADVVEANFSCPNVTSCDGQLYQNPQDAGKVAARIRQLVGNSPLVLKVGYLPDPTQQQAFLEAVADSASAIATTNGIAARITNGTDPMWQGERRGICGDGIRTESLRQVASMRDIIRRRNLPIELVGVGGIKNHKHVQQYLDAGASTVQLATQVMLDPTVGIQIKEEWNSN